MSSDSAPPRGLASSWRADTSEGVLGILFQSGRRPKRFRLLGRTPAPAGARQIHSSRHGRPALAGARDNLSSVGFCYSLTRSIRKATRTCARHSSRLSPRRPVETTSTALMLRRVWRASLRAACTAASEPSLEEPTTSMILTTDTVLLSWQDGTTRPYGIALEKSHLVVGRLGAAWLRNSRACTGPAAE